MVEFKNLKVTACPSCGEQTIVSEEVETSERRSFCSGKVSGRVIREHTNGQRWEHRKFMCGCVVSWSPNFSAAEVTNPCPTDEGYSAYKKQLDELLQAEHDLREKRRKLEEKRNNEFKRIIR